MGSVYSVTIYQTNKSTVIQTLPDGFRISEATGSRRESSVVIPYADGEKDTSDGCKGTGTVTVEGVVYGSNAATLEDAIRGYIATIEAATDDFLVCYKIGASARRYHRVQYLQSWSVGSRNGSGLLWQTLTLTFKKLENPTFAS